jgi:class 3 adenylate cyclase
MGVDEERTLAQLKAHRVNLVEPKTTEHRGRIVKTTGDGMLVEFVSVLAAVRCAVDIQRGMVERNAAIPQERRIEFRVGINLGDVIIEDQDIFGDGVNVAARLEGLAEPGGICVSGRVQENAHAPQSTHATRPENGTRSGQSYFRDVDVPTALLQRAITSASTGKSAVEHTELVNYLRSQSDTFDHRARILIESTLAGRLAKVGFQRGDITDEFGWVRRIS